MKIIKSTKTIAPKAGCAKKAVACKCAKTTKGACKKSAEKSVTFTVHADSGKQVFLAGSFNNWNPADKKMAEKKGSGLYSTTVKLAPGSYQYKFVIDGTWCQDPENADAVQNELGTLNSVINVK